MSNHHNHLRIYRKKTYLTQEDMVHVLGARYDFTHLSKCENGARATNIEILVTYHLILDIPIEKLIAKRRERIRRALLPRIQKRIESLKDAPNLSRSRHRIKHLENTLIKLTKPDYD